MKDQLNTLNLRNNNEPKEEYAWGEDIANNEIAWQMERNKQEDRIRLVREENQIRSAEKEQLKAEQSTQTKGIGKTTFVMMLTVAIAADIIVALISLIPVVGWVINWLVTPMIFLTFFVWFKIKGLKFNSARKMAALPAGFLIELIPYINLLPGWTVSVIINTQADKVLKVVDTNLKGDSYRFEDYRASNETRKAA